jgi:hypothetical protein
VYFVGVKGGNGSSFPALAKTWQALSEPIKKYAEPVGICKVIEEYPLAEGVLGFIVECDEIATFAELMKVIKAIETAVSDFSYTLKSTIPLEGRIEIGNL